MKISAIIFALAATMTAATPAHEGAALLTRATDCNRCHSQYDFCVANGHTVGQEGCMKTCREIVCFRDIGCKGCGQPFGLCPGKARWVH
ncbi:hypothetical protein EJ02DRAFT_451769 [Clathrospora elynae]|uniref:Uncharacterized protein n=1 Tax=Clathrospora elynae TaxID=706981 RepID=A0A6A5SYY5_9PLEO|nr:hypothetical protein EJ02DRAFT_451769 [Clathrospora elynae]